MQSDSYKRLTTLSCQRCSKDYQPTINKDGSIRKTKGEFCSQWCRSASGKPIVLASTKKLEPIPCKNCGEMFKPRKEKYGRGSFCSRKCFNDCKEIKMPNSQLAAEVRALLRIASRPVIESRSIIVLKEMAGLLRIQRANKKTWWEKNSLTYGHKKKVVRLSCSMCESSFLYIMGSGLAPKYCDPCKKTKIKESKKNTRKKWRAKFGNNGNYRQRAKRANAIYQSIKPIEVFERDNWRCHICHIKTPKELRGTFEPNAPELDHIVTLAEGGSHTYGNVACACRACNGKKGAKSLGQLKFF